MSNMRQVSGKPFPHKPWQQLLVGAMIGCLTIGSAVSLPAEAKSTGGRSRGGSFTPSRSTGGGSSNRNDSPSRQGGDYRPAPSGGGGYYPSGGYYNGGGYYGGPSYRSGGAGNFVAAMLMILAIVAVGGVALWFWVGVKAKKPAAAGSMDEIHNDIVSVSEIQIALLANSPIQKQLTEIVQTMAIDTPTQLKEQFQTVVVELLRQSEYWSHAKVSSQTFKTKTEAEGFFEQWSIRSRSKLSQETLTRDSLGLKQRDLVVNPEDDPAAYVVVTMLIGTTHDRPLAEQTYSEESLRAVLTKLSAITERELLVFELMWSPQDASDSLSRDELLTEYGDLVMV
jgi:uncharacterized membrane protein